MALMQPRAKQAIWANDDIGAAEAALAGAGGAAAGAGPALPGVVLEDGDSSDDELYEELPGSAPASDDEEEEGGDGSGGALDPVVADAGVSDMDYLRARVRKNFSDDEEEEEEEATAEEASESEEEAAAGGSEGEEGQSGDEEMEEAAAADGDGLDAIFDGKKKPGKPEKPAAAAEEAEPGLRATAAGRDRDGDPVTSISQTGRLFVRNLPYTATEEDLRAVFAAHGEVEEAHLVLDRATRRSKGFALVQFARPGDAVAAHAALDGSIFMGRLMHVLPGQRAPAGEGEGNAADGADGGGPPDGKATSSYKRKKEADLKASAGNKVAWNSLFMRADTVAEAVAAHYGVSKADLLDPSAPDMAVRMALGETQVIAETKAALAGAGVDVAALEAAAAAAGKGAAAAAPGARLERSDRVLLVKNLPYSAEEGDLEALFARAGPVLRVVLPPTRTLALVEFGEAQDARKAFKTLAYKRYQSVPIYIEWAPAGVLSAPPPAPKAAPKAAEKAPAPEKAAAARPEEVAAELAAAAGDDALDSATVYVKNLSFKSEDAGLRAHFEGAAAAAGGALRAAKVARRKARDGTLLSSGFGFVECSTEAVAREVIAALQGSTLDGHHLVLQLAQRGAAGAGTRGGGGAPAPATKGATKIVVRNLAFEASRGDILGLFTPFGAVKSCRLPRKFDGSHRGFAFVEFATPQEARGAVDAVTGTHLYGRRLAIEWAADDGGLDELREKTAKKFRGEPGALRQAGAGRAAGCSGAEEEDGGARKRRRKQG